ncbi:FAD-dependent oxidoreductase [Patiriisocius marinus]|uniref:FAD-dependent oxidoreductase n=2 Tax=Patiriisocius marinus TaxID=1397112 RepID=A0A5J4J0W8_9FLAO|nr:FAD-dependent oxidoreductase [Patiriisocius marinus]
MPYNPEIRAMIKLTHFDVLIIGGGLAGLSTAIHLSKQNVKVLVIEKQKYPHHKVCGEYVSNEVLPYLKQLGVNPLYHNAAEISKFKITDTFNIEIDVQLDLGGFGISRFSLDAILYDEARKNSEFIFDTVTSITYEVNDISKKSIFSVLTSANSLYTADYVVGSFGKRSNLDKSLNRTFIQKKTPWMAVKGHYTYEMPNNQVQLHNFKGGYCGLSKTETGQVNACYLSKVSAFKKYKSIKAFQKEHLSKNKHLKHFFETAVPVFEKPLTISQISFENKEPISNHIFMLGDSAGLIHPLCGNGMAMAIHSAKIFSELYLKSRNESSDSRQWLEDNYALKWNNAFQKRLKAGSVIQRILLNETSSKIGLKIASVFPQIVPSIIKKTHGSPMI